MFKINKNLRKFATSTLKIKEFKPVEKIKVEYKDFYFKYQNIQFKSNIPKSVDQSIAEFLNHFGKDRSINSKIQLNHLDYEMTRGGKYLNQNILINEMITQPDETNPIMIFDENLSLNCMRFRNLNHLVTPFETSSNPLQTFLYQFIEKIQFDNTKIETEYLKTLVKTLNNIKENRSKLLIAVGSLLDKIKSFTSNQLNIVLNTNYKLDMQKLNKRDKLNLFVIENKDSKSLIPINLVESRNEEERIKAFDEAIIDNFDSLRKLSTVNNYKANFGIVTDFYNWKFNYYHQNQNNIVESEKDFHTSLKYSLTVSSEYINEQTYLILLKVLYGVISLDAEKLNSIKI
jgi:hypothetical protein